jgi:hypothetical protein
LSTINQNSTPSPSGGLGVKRFSQRDPILFWSYVYNGTEHRWFLNPPLYGTSGNRPYRKTLNSFTERMADVKTISRYFTGCHIEHPRKDQFLFGLELCFSRLRNWRCNGGSLVAMKRDYAFAISFGANWNAGIKNIFPSPTPQRRALGINK